MQVTIATNCLNGHSVSWQSQPLIEGTAAGNILISAAILFSGNTYKRTVDFAKYLNLQFVSYSHYYTTQSTILFPVVQHTWITSQSALVKKLEQSDSVDVCGDGRCDSTGHSAKYGTFTLMDEKTNLIIEFSLVQVTEQVGDQKAVKEGKKLKKDCQELLPWIQSDSNHLWWCSVTCEQNADGLSEKWLSLLHHITGKHCWGASKEFKLVKRCGHPRISREDQKEIVWVENGSPAHVALEEFITKKKLLKDLAKLTEFHHTESYHSLMTKYTPKREHFCYNGMVARTQLAVLDHNANVNRTQAEVKEGSKQGEKSFNIVFGKQRKNWVAKEIKTPKSSSYVEGMMNDVILCKKGKKFKYKPKT
ncbi:Hypothetical predicted protein [Paramuricea clavata]|uniref:Uncharacterized protein n=1 Tax=Paramuricea clavata TaxID=317549 RepID=A0A7D9HFQ3_PARCT|nr:Hypothetical predicted protein [Paramuricea clavata]